METPPCADPRSSTRAHPLALVPVWICPVALVLLLTGFAAARRQATLPLLLTIDGTVFAASAGVVFLRKTPKSSRLLALALIASTGLVGGALLADLSHAPGEPLWSVRFAFVAAYSVWCAFRDTGGVDVRHWAHPSPFTRIATYALALWLAKIGFATWKAGVATAAAEFRDYFFPGLFTAILLVVITEMAAHSASGDL